VDAAQGVTCLGATVTVIEGPEVSGQRAEYLPEYYGPEYIQQVAPNSKTWKIDPLFNNGALDADGSRLEVYAQDQYGNKQVSVTTGDVIEYAPGR